MAGKKKVGKKKAKHSRRGGRHTAVMPAHLLGKTMHKKTRRKKSY